VIAGTFGGGAFLSTDGGASWAPATTGLADTVVYSLLVDSVGSGYDIQAGTAKGLFRSTDGGGSWTAETNGFTGSHVHALGSSGSVLFAGTYGNGVFRSGNNGESWAAVNDGLANLNVYSLAIVDTFLLAGTYGNGVWRRPLSEMVTSVDAYPTGERPGAFVLKQNYPNPFNSSTVISYTLPEAAPVTLRIVNTLGEEVQVLTRAVQQAGSYQIHVEGLSLPSGCYFYTLTAGVYRSTKKMLLVK
jgi:hypothetical protein